MCICIFEGVYPSQELLRVMPFYGLTSPWWCSGEGDWGSGTNMSEIHELSCERDCVLVRSKRALKFWRREPDKGVPETKRKRQRDWEPSKLERDTLNSGMRYFRRKETCILDVAASSRCTYVVGQFLLCTIYWKEQRNKVRHVRTKSTTYSYGKL